MAAGSLIQPGTQTPPLQKPTGQGTPSGAGVCWHPALGEHESVVHTFPSSQLTGTWVHPVAGLQSSVVHSSPSSQEVTEPDPQVPEPSHLPGEVYLLFTQDADEHTALSPHIAHAPSPLHVPVVPHVSAAVDGQSSFGSVPDNAVTQDVPVSSITWQAGHVFPLGAQRFPVRAV